jgi:hypothetical protein
MKITKIFLAAMMMATTAFAQSNQSMKLETLPVEHQAKLVKQAKLELEGLQTRLEIAKIRQNKNIVIGITSATVAVVGAYMTFGALNRMQTVSGGLRTTFAIISGLSSAATVGGVLVSETALVAYVVRANEIDSLIKEIEKARIAVDAADRTYEMMEHL